MRFAAFFGEEKPFPAYGTDLKSVANWRYDWRQIDRENFQNLRKWVQSLCAPHRLFRSELKEKLHHTILPYIYLNISLAHYSVPRKTLKFVPVVQKAHVRANVCAHRKSIKPCNSKKMFLGAFYTGWFIVVHPYSNFSLRRQMAPVYSIKFQTANFPIFCASIIVIFWTTCIAIGKCFSLRGLW